MEKHIHFGMYHHGEYFTGRNKDQEENQRIDHFAKYGFKTLIIWQDELRSNKPKLIEKIKSFTYG